MIDQAFHALLDRAFAGDGYVHKKIADLRIRSGAIVAADPLTGLTDPFTIEIPKGDHPVTLIYSDADQWAPCGALVVFAEDRPVRWEMAVVPGQDLSALRPGHIFGYPVDTGLGSFVDLAAARMWRTELDAFDDVPDELEDAVFGSPCYESHVIGSYLSEEDASLVDNPEGYNIVIFPSGGDGYFATWVGVDVHDQPVCLLTDFDL